VRLAEIYLDEIQVREELGILHDAESGYANVPTSSIEELLSLAHTSPPANRVARHVAADAFRHNREASRELRNFGAKIILGLEKEPRVPPRRKTWLRQEFFFALSKAVLERFELMATRNASTRKREARSACDAVAEGLGKAGYATTYRAIQEIYSGTGPDAVRLREEFLQHLNLLMKRNMRHPIEKHFAEADRRRYGDRRLSP
jgi:hypothetical protein